MRWVLVMLVMLGFARAAWADITVTLRPVARVPAGTPLTVGDVAAVSDASIGALPLGRTADAGSRLTIGVDEVSAVLQAHGVGRSGVSVRGDRCTVIVRETPAQPAPAEPDVMPTTPVDPVRGATVRDHIRGTLERLLGASSGTLELRFDEDDAAVLGRATAGMTVEVHTTGLGRRTPVRVTLYASDGSMEVVRVPVGIRQLREVARANRPLSRGTAVGPADITVSAEWLAPDEPYVEPVLAIGQRLRRGVQTGDMLTDGNVEPPISIERGDIVMVHVVSGAVVIRREARAVESGRTGERIRLEPLSGGAAFPARVEGPGRAVIIATPTGIGEGA